MKADAKPIAVEIRDDDGLFHEIDSSQCLEQDVTINGVEYSAGDNILSAYHLSNSDSGHVVTSFHVGGGITGYQQGDVQGIVSTEKLEPGKSYKFNCEKTSYRHELEYSKSVACFGRGTAIDTPCGPRRIEDLTIGDPVLTSDDAARPTFWVGHSRVLAAGNFAPVVFSIGAIGNAVELVVSPQHRMLLSGGSCEILFGEAEVLVPALYMVNDHSIVRRIGGVIDYYHLMFRRHEIVFSNGVPSESFYASQYGAKGFDYATRSELLALFPELSKTKTGFGQTARRVLKRHEFQVLDQFSVSGKPELFPRCAAVARPAELPRAAVSA